MAAIRPIDRWFIDHVLPHEARFLQRARRLTRTNDDARELVQDAFMRLFTLQRWATIAEPRSYVLRMLRNIAIERMRRARIVEFERLSDMDSFDPVDDAPDAFRVASSRDQVRRMLAVLEKMPETYRTILIERRLDDRTPTEMARDSGTSLSTVEKRLARAIHLLNQGMQAYKEPAEGQAQHSPPQGRCARLNRHLCK